MLYSPHYLKKVKFKEHGINSKGKNKPLLGIALVKLKDQRKASQEMD